MCEKDVYYTHRRNIFVFDSEDYYRTDNDKDSSKPQKPVFAEKGYLYAQEESIKRGRLMLNCYWQIPVIQGEEVKIEWHHKLVDIAELTFDAIRKDAFFHDSDYDFKEVADPHKRELIENWERAKEDRWSKIFKGIQERKEHFEQTESRKIARENEQNMLTRILSGEIIPEPFKLGDIYGYKAEDVVVIKPQYAMAFPFRNGTAIVINKRGRRGLINLRNERILDIKYNKLGWLDKDNPNILFGTEGSPTPFNLFYSTGEKVVDYLINGIKKINGNYVFIKYSNKGFGIMSDEGKVLIEPIYGKIAPKEDDRYILTYAGRTKTIKSDISDVRTNIITELMPGNFIAERLLFYGVVDASGDTVLPFRYSKIERFSEKYISVEEKDGSTLYNGLMDNSFNMVMPMKTAQITVLPNGAILREGTLYDSNLKALLVGYDCIEPCPDGKYILCKRISSGWYKSYNKYGLADETGNILFPCVALQAVKNKNDNVDYIVEYLGNGGSIRSCFAILGLFDASGQLLTGRIYTKMEKLPNGNLLVTYNNKQGIITQTGEEVVPCNYDSLNLTDSGEVKVITEPLDGFCQKYGYLDKYALSDMDGNLLTNYIFDEIDLLSEGLYVAKDYNSRSLLDRFGHIINKSSDDTEFHPLDGGSILVIEDGIRYGIMNREGLLIIPVDFSFIELLPNGNFLVRQENYRETLYGVFKPDGSVLVECIYHEICTDSNGDIRPKFIPLNEDFFKACQFDKYALANRSKVLLTDFLYESLEVFDDNNYLVTLNGQNGLIDSEGQVVLSLTINDVISVISNDRFLVGKPFKKGVLDSKGAVVVPVEYYNIEKLPNDTWKVDKVQYANHLFGIYGDDGRIVLECKYKEINTDADGNVIPAFSGTEDKLFRAKLLDKYALCSNERVILTEYKYNDIKKAGDDFFIVEMDNQQGVIDRLGKEILPLSDFQVKSVVDRNHFVFLKQCIYGLVNDKGTILTSKQYTNFTVLGNGTFLGERDYYDSGQYRYIYELIDSEGKILFSSNKKIVFDDNFQPVSKIEMSFGNVSVWQCCDKYAISFGDTISLSDYKYDSVEKINETLLNVGKDDYYGLLDMNGNVVLPIEYNSDFEILSLGIIKFSKDKYDKKRYGLCDSSGKLLAQPVNTFIRENSPGHFKLFYKEGNDQKSRFFELKDPVKFVVGQNYIGRVNGIQEYGLFVKVQGGGSGLLHIKQIKKHGKDINSFSKGDKLSVKVINIRKDGKVEFDLI